jgi:putative ABC transport system substrate-binding protein
MIARRGFLGLIGAAAAWPVAARAQQSTRTPTIGFLGANTPTTQSNFTAAFVQRLRQLGWTEGRNMVIEYRWAEGRVDRYADIASELVQARVDVIVTSTAQPALAAKRVTSTIPIVVAAISPDVPGLVDSLARPGGNVTGVSPQNTDLAGKRLELLREVVPAMHRLGYLTNVARSAFRVEMEEVQLAAQKLGLELVTLEIRRAEDITPAFDALKGRADALFVSPEPLVFVNRTRISTLAIAQRLPTMHGIREYVESGGLMSYGANIAELFRRCADYVDKILRGAKPADLPVEQASRFELVVNLTTAKALGLVVPPMLLGRADEVIE